MLYEIRAQLDMLGSMCSCPVCGKEIELGAFRCIHCRSPLAPRKSEPASQRVGTSPNPANVDRRDLIHRGNRVVLLGIAAILALIAVPAAFLFLRRPSVAIPSPAAQKVQPPRDRLLARVPDELRLVRFSVSPDRRHVAYLALRGKKFVVVQDDVPGEEFNIALPPLWSPDSKSLAYQATTIGLRSVVVVDGKPGEEFESVTNLVFSPTSAVVAYKARQNHRPLVVVGDRKGEPYDLPDATFDKSPVFSPDGSRVAYSAYDSRKLQRLVLVGDRKIGPFGDLTGNPVFAPDGKVAFAARPLMKTTVTPDGRTVYSSFDQGKAFVQVGDEKFGGFDDVWQPVFSPDGSTVAFNARVNDKWFVVVGGRNGPEFEFRGGFNYWPPVFSGDGKTVAYLARNSFAQFVAVGDRKGGQFAQVWRPALNADGSLAAYAAARDNKVFMVVGDKSREHEGLSPESLVFGPDGATVAYKAHQGGKWFVVVGDRRTDEFDQIESVSFTPDGRSVEFGAVQTREIWWKVVDQGTLRELPPPGAEPPQPVEDPALTMLLQEKIRSAQQDWAEGRRDRAKETIVQIARLHPGRPEGLNALRMIEWMAADAARPAQSLTPSTCSERLTQLWKMQSVYRSQFGGRQKSLPKETGPAFWLALTKTSPPLLDSTEQWPWLICPLGGQKPRPGFTTYRGPRETLNAVKPETVVGCCGPGCHPDGTISVLRGDGSVTQVGPTDPLYQRALEATFGAQEEDLVREAAAKHATTLGTVQDVQVHGTVAEIRVAGRRVLFAEFSKESGTWAFSKDLGADFERLMNDPATSAAVLQRLTQRITDRLSVSVKVWEGIRYAYAVSRDAQGLVGQVDVHFAYPKAGEVQRLGRYVETFQYAAGAWQSQGPGALYADAK